MVLYPGQVVLGVVVRIVVRQDVQYFRIHVNERFLRMETQYQSIIKLVKQHKP